MIIEEDEKKVSESKVIRAMKKLQGQFNPEATSIINTSISGREMIIDQANFALMISDHPKEPANFKEAGDHPIEDQERKWQEVIQKELIFGMLEKLRFKLQYL